MGIPPQGRHSHCRLPLYGQQAYPQVWGCSIHLPPATIKLLGGRLDSGSTRAAEVEYHWLRSQPHACLATTRDILFSSPGLMTHIADDWLFAFTEARLLEPKSTHLLLHLLVCDQCCNLANQDREYKNMTKEVITGDE